MKKIVIILFSLLINFSAQAQTVAPAEKNQLSQYNYKAQEKASSQKQKTKKEIPPYLGKMSEVKKAQPKTYRGGKFNSFFNQSLFPLQDQTRFYSKTFEIRENKCNADGTFAIYNIRNKNSDTLEYDCVGRVNAACGPECFDDGVFFGNHIPQYMCIGSVSDEFNEEKTLTKKVCWDNKHNMLWERNINDNYVFDNTGRLQFFQNNTTFVQYLNSKLKEKYVYDENEYMYFSAENPNEFFHVQYERDANGRVIKEFHFNHEGFPYYIFVANYQDGKCTKIIKYDGYKGTSEIYEF